MYCVNDFIFVTFNPGEKLVRNGLIVPFVWEHLDEFGLYTGKREENIDYRQTNQQTGIVLAENPKYPFKQGDKVVFHYLAIEREVEGGAFIRGNDIFFTDNGEIKMVEGTYLCEQLYDDIPQTPSGIYLGHIEQKKECHLKVLHSGGDYKPGDTIFTIDGAQYEFEYNGRKYIKVLEHEIIGHEATV